jgi:adenylosuccinate synthase
MNEYDDLIEKGENPKIFIDPECSVITPFDITANEVEYKISEKNMSCCSGIFKTIERERAGYQLKFMDLYYPSVVANKVHRIAEYYSSYRFANFSKFHQDMAKTLLSTNMIDAWESYGDFLEAIEDMKKVSDDIKCSSLKSDEMFTYIFEGSQGLLLDQDIGFYPYVTPSNTGSKNIRKLLSNWIYVDMETWYITRAYQTRHGDGPMSEGIFKNLPMNPEEKNFDNGPQGKFRIAPLDLDMLKYVIKTDQREARKGKATLIVTCMDLIKDNYYLFKDSLREYNKKDFLKEILSASGCRSLKISDSAIGDLKDA